MHAKAKIKCFDSRLTNDSYLGSERSAIRVNDHAVHRSEHRFPGDGTPRDERVHTTGTEHRQQSVHQYLHLRMFTEAVSVEQRLLCQRMEQFRSDNSVGVSDRSYLRAGRRSLCDTRTEASTSLETGPVVDDDEGTPEHHHLDDRRARKPDSGTCDRDLHIRRDRHAIVQQRLYIGQVLS